MASSSSGHSVVLVVDDEEAIADTYTLHLESHYEVRTAYGGTEALEKLDEDVDAVVLDRRMPDLHGDDVLEAIRDRGYTCTVIMATAVGPDLNILEMDFDDYLCKPIDRETLLETLETHLDSEASGDLETFFRLVSKRSVLEAEQTRAELEDSDEYARLQTRIDDLEAELRERIDGFDDVIATHRDIGRGS
ncbi:response regulator transcription factor [Salinibaculum rarum]|uniref:response regulator transcription factor n=1 Tax=Salinibaculum rarum TaxID=3058903 RepID=UPI00265D6A5E|nr:response regulator [Salinibaculum sp. KK48]